MLDMADVAVNIGNVDGKPNKMRRWYDEENIRRVVDDWLSKNPGVSIIYPNNDNNENETMATFDDIICGFDDFAFCVIFDSL